MLVSIQLETCHANSDGTAWYAYIKGVTEPGTNEVVRPTIRLVKSLMQGVEVSDYDQAPLGFNLSDAIEEVPNHLSKHTGLWRFYVGEAS